MWSRRLVTQLPPETYACSLCQHVIRIVDSCDELKPPGEQSYPITTPIPKVYGDSFILPDSQEAFANKT